MRFQIEGKNWLCRGGRRLARESLKLLAACCAHSIKPSSSAVKVSYYSRSYPLSPPRGDGQALGGEVKLTYLQRAFPHSPRDPSILYVVSSVVREDVLRVLQIHKRRGARVVLNQNGLYYQAWFGDGWAKRNAVFPDLLNGADAVIFQSEFCRRACREILGVEVPESIVLHNPVDTEHFVPRQPRSTGTAPMLMTISPPLRQYYRIRAAIGALAIARKSLPECRLLVAGVDVASPHWSELSAAIRDALQSFNLSADCLELAPRYDRKTAPQVFQRADLLLHTACNDPCPNVVVEAMACGLPVVFSSTGGVPELVTSQEGVGVPSDCTWERFLPPSPEALAAGIVHIFNELPSFASKARSRAERLFSLGTYFERHREVFQKFLTGVSRAES